MFVRVLLVLFKYFIVGMHGFDQLLKTEIDQKYQRNLHDG